MKITSFNYFVFLVITTVLYYILPKKHRWILLLIASLAFFLLASYQSVLYFIFGILISYFGALLIDKKCKSEKVKKFVLFVTITCEIGELFLLKYTNIFQNNINWFGNLFSTNINSSEVNLIIPIGISYYTLSIISYVVDVYRTAIPAEKNLFKYLLYSCYYPCLISGPIIRYTQMKEEFFSNRKLDWNNIFKGFHRIIFGLLKKMVIADNVAILVELIFKDINTYSGIYIVFGALLYALQIYCDFSGCMDIIIGSSRLYGIKIPENFKSPFFSRNLSEFWRRWHITLGEWGKDYIMYPLLKSKIFQKIGKRIKNDLGKDIGKKVPVMIATLILWTFIGIWHDISYKYIFAAGILPWIYFYLNEIFEKVFVKFNEKFKVNKDSLSFHLFQSIRTLLLMCIIWIYVIAPEELTGSEMIMNIFNPSKVDILTFLNTNIFNDVYKFLSILISILIVAVVDYLIYKKYDVGDKFNSQGMWFRYLVLFTMITIILIYGVYGPGYNPADFIYGGF